MAKIYSTGSIFDHPRRRKKLSWYAEILCSRLRKQEQISEEDIKRYWDVVRSKQEELPFQWQKDNLAQQAEEQLKDLLSGYWYDPGSGVYKRK
jgi:hypothetical protein